MDARSRFVTLVVGTSLAVASAAGIGGSVAAGSPVHEVELVGGTCDEPVGVAVVLAQLWPEADLSAAPVEIGEVVEALGSAVSSGYVAVPKPMQDLTAGAHAIRVVERGRPPERIVACGQFEGGEGAVADIQVGLVGSGGSGLHGVAWLRDNGDGTTGASVAIAALASQDLSASASGDVEVAIRKSIYVPNPLEVEAGSTVTWVNEDVLPHTVTSSEGSFDSGYMPLDARFSRTFDEPGEYPIFCVYHPRMRSVVIVS